MKKSVVLVLLFTIGVLLFSLPVSAHYNYEYKSTRYTHCDYNRDYNCMRHVNTYKIDSHSDYNSRYDTTTHKHGHTHCYDQATKNKPKHKQRCVTHSHTHTHYGYDYDYNNHH